MATGNPGWAAVVGMPVGTVLKLDGKTWTVSYASPNFLGLTGSKGGSASLVPTTCRTRVRVNTVNRMGECVRTLEVL